MAHPVSFAHLRAPNPTSKTMAINVPIELAYEFNVKAPANEVFEVLSDVPTSVSHFPKVDQLVDLGGGAYRWEMEKVGTAQVNIQTVYACQYVANRSKGTVTWTPVPDVGNAQVSGHWRIRAGKEGTAIELALEATVSVPLPGLMKMVVAPVVEAEFEKLVDQYVDNLIRRFGGEV